MQKVWHVKIRKDYHYRTVEVGYSNYNWVLNMKEGGAPQRAEGLPGLWWETCIHQRKRAGRDLLPVVVADSWTLGCEEPSSRGPLNL